MKVLTPLLAFTLLFSACSKKDTLSTPGGEITGQLKYGGGPAADGYGYYMTTDSTHETLSLQNLPAEYRHTDVNAHIAVRFFDTGQTMTMKALPGSVGPRIVVVRAIRKL
ncbi:MAG: hypothetical protein J0H74_02195 [Chitinophagaceae bacterium]|nr:hypothetical protein [Chitinophagaceae bacterium]